MPLVAVEKKGEEDKVSIEEKVLDKEHDGAKEYSVSGWARWQDPLKIGPWHLLFRMSHIRPAELENLTNYGDRTLVIWKGVGFYH